MEKTNCEVCGSKVIIGFGGTHSMTQHYIPDTSEIEELKAEKEERNKWIRNQSELVQSQIKEIEELKSDEEEHVNQILLLSKLVKILQSQINEYRNQLADQEHENSILKERCTNFLKCMCEIQNHINMDDPDWGERSALAFAARLGLIDISVRQCLKEDSGREK